MREVVTAQYIIQSVPKDSLFLFLHGCPETQYFFPVHPLWLSVMNPDQYLIVILEYLNLEFQCT